MLTLISFQLPGWHFRGGLFHCGVGGIAAIRLNLLVLLKIDQSLAHALSPLVSFHLRLTLWGILIL